MSEDKVEADVGRRERGPRRRRESLFGPVVLITAGVLLLLNNLGLLPPLYWEAAIQLWPLFLIFIGINIIAGLAPRPFDRLLTALVGITAVAVFVFVLLFADRVPVLRNAAENQTLQREQIAFPAAGVETAVVEIEFAEMGGEITALDDSANLIEGDISYWGDLIFNSTVSDGRAVVELDTTGQPGNPFFWLTRQDRPRSGPADQWQIGLNPAIPLDLRLDLPSGAVNLDLSRLALRDLAIDGASGRSVVMLPAGDYDLYYDVASGAVELTFPESGRQTFNIDGGSGRLSIMVPPSLASRIHVEDGSGAFSIDDRFWSLESGDEDVAIWVTDGYEDASNRVELFLDVASGAVQIEMMSGR